MHKMTNTDLGRILQSEELHKALRAPKYDLKSLAQLTLNMY